MLLAVISDIHGNLEALDRVLEDMDSHQPDAVVCLGDTIGYGPEPELCLERIRDRDIPCVMGNHERGVSRKKGRSWFNPVVRKTLTKTRDMLAPESLDYVATLPLSLALYGHWFVHGYPPDSPVVYMFEKENEEIAATLEIMDNEFCFVGHTHELVIAVHTPHAPDALERRDLTPGAHTLERGLKYMVNVGAVGQPRDGDNRAKYVFWDDEARILTVRAVDYDIEATAKRILELGYPEQYARRLR